MTGPQALSAAMRALVPGEHGRPWEDALAAEWEAIGAGSPVAACMFVANLAHESDGFARLEENLRYTSLDRLTRVFGRERLGDNPELLVRRPEALANRVYAHRNGNGDDRSGDGWRYRGRGPIQLTGRLNYEAESIPGADLVADPDLMLVPTIGGPVSVRWWNYRRLSKLADALDLEGVTRRINGGLTGLAERHALFVRAVGAVARA